MSYMLMSLAIARHRQLKNKAFMAKGNIQILHLKAKHFPSYCKLSLCSASLFRRIKIRTAHYQDVPDNKSTNLCYVDRELCVLYSRYILFFYHNLSFTTAFCLFCFLIEDQQVRKIHYTHTTLRNADEVMWSASNACSIKNFGPGFFYQCYFIALCVRFSPKTLSIGSHVWDSSGHA